MASELESAVFGDEKDEIDERVATMTNDDLRHQVRALDNEIRVMKSNINRIKHESSKQKEHIKDNKEKVKLNKQLPYLVANVVEIVEPFNDPDEDGADTSVTDSSLVPTCKGNFIVNKELNETF